jgi:chromate transport protein ChrA
MNAALKILIGLLFIVVGFGLFVDSVYGNQWTGVRIAWWGNFVTVVTGVIPALLILMGLFIVWLEADEVKAEKEMGTESSDEASEVKKAVATPQKKQPARRKKK